MEMKLVEQVSADTEGVAQRLRDGMAGGVPAFPLASFREDGGLGLESYRAHPTAQVAAAPGALFPACGTGEFSALHVPGYAVSLLDAGPDLAGATRRAA
ncbi:hypothetical protein ADK82_30710 [Streptomyces sp. NRRL S-4]|nr:hypothetical protein ADK82_30710 [Streptomyces sp. NRRL S-4]